MYDEDRAVGESALPRFVDDEYDDGYLREQRAVERRRRFTSTIDIYLVLTVGVLVAIGLMMVWSTTFFWSDPQSALFVQQARNAFIGLIAMLIIGAIDYHIWRRLAIPFMAAVLIALCLVLILPGVKVVFGAKRAFFDGAVQPSEVAMVAVVVYMSAWLSSKQSKLHHLTYGLLPFALLVSTVGGLIILEPDISTAFLILATASLMFFLAGADWIQMGFIMLVFVLGGIISISQFDYARARVQSFLDLLRDPISSQASHAQNVIIAFLNGGI